MLEHLSALVSKGVEPINDTFKESEVKSLKDSSPLKSSMYIIENTSLEALKAQNEITGKEIYVENLHSIEKNREDGANREELAFKELQREFPEEEGYKIEREQYLRDEDGNIVKDPVTGEARRIDFVVTKDGQAVRSVEVTSETAPKATQISKEGRIRDAGGNFIKDRETGQLVEIPKDIQTEVRRYP